MELDDLIISQEPDKFGVPYKKSDRLINIMKTSDLLTYKYLCPDVYPNKITCLVIKNIFLNFEKNIDKKQHLYFKINHNECYYFFDQENEHIEKISDPDFNLLKEYFLKNQNSQDLSWSDILVFDAKMITYQFKRYYKDGYYYIMIHPIYKTEGITDLITIRKTGELNFNINYSISLTYREGLFQIFNEYTSSTDLIKYTEAFNKQMKIIDYFVKSKISAVHIKRDIIIKLQVRFEINNGIVNENSYDIYFSLKNYSNSVIDDKGYSFKETTFHLDINGFLISDFFQYALGMVNNKYNNNFDISTKENFESTLKILEILTI